jgi:type I restriction enzyme R subunit
MWLTGFDAPCLHTLYVDKPMTGHNLMQAIARVNRVFKDKEGGLIVDYLGIAQDLKKALSIYTESGGKGQIEFDQEEAVAKMMELYEIVVAMFEKFDYKKFFGLQTKEKLNFILNATDYVLSLEKGKDRFNTNVGNLPKHLHFQCHIQKQLKYEMMLLCFSNQSKDYKTQGKSKEKN